MRLKSRVIFLLFLCFFIISGTAYATTRLLFVAPGETFTSGVNPGKSGKPVSQTAGVPFNVTVYAVDDVSWLLQNSNAASVSVTAIPGTLATSYNPVSPFNLTTSDSGVNNCKSIISITIDPAINGNVRFDGTTSSGIGYNSVTITCQLLSSFVFNPITSPQTSGIAFSYTITAKDPAGNVCTGYNGTALLNEVYNPPGTPVSVGPAKFVNGIANGTTTPNSPVTLYQETYLTQMVTVTASSASQPVVLASAGMSNNFAVSASGTGAQLLLMGPGQQMLPGTTSGNGRAGASEQAPTVQTAGSPFWVTVYACDAYWNTVNSAASYVTLTSSDPLAVISPVAQNLTAGKAYFKVTLETVGTGAQSLTVTTAAMTADTDSIQVQSGSFSKFGFEPASLGSQTAGTAFFITAVAEDLYGNTVPSFNNSATLNVIFGGDNGNTLGANYWAPPPAPVFTNGVYISPALRVYKSVTNTLLRIASSGVVTDSSQFTINPNALNKLLLIAPGEFFDPGNNSVFPTGKTGTPLAQVAGIGAIMTVYATDRYGNWITTVTDNIQVSSTTDLNATALGLPLPATTALAIGTTTFNFIFGTNGTQNITIGDLTNGAVINAADNILVNAAGLDHFDVNINSPRTAGDFTSPTIVAKDKFGNAVTTYNGNIWITSPDTDYAFPAETSISITSVNSGAGTASLIGDYKWHVTFTAGTGGVLTLDNFSMHRATTWTAQVFVSDKEDDSPNTWNAQGHWGKSGQITIIPGVFYRMMVLPPGMTARPGTPEGRIGSPTGQIVGAPFSVTMLACDAWFNTILTGLGASTQMSIVPSNSANAVALNPASGWPVSMLPALGNGVLTLEYNNFTSTNFTLTLNSQLGGIYPDTCPPINIFYVNHFIIQVPAYTPVAGAAFPITITAYQSSDNSVIATGFDNVSIQLNADNQYSDSETTLSPMNSVTFTAGVCVMNNIKIFRATVGGSYVHIIPKFGSITTYSSPQMQIANGPVAQAVFLVDGMQLKPGLVQLGEPGYAGYSGGPNPQTAGNQFNGEIVYCDVNFNRCYDAAATSCKITDPSDPQATVGGGLLSGNVTVPVTTGSSGDINSPSALQIILRTVGPTGLQQLTGIPTGSPPTTFSSPPIRMLHAALDHFAVLAPATHQIAGHPFSITIQALDAYGNLMDATNGATPFSLGVALNATKLNTMYPTSTTLNLGQTVVPVQLFRAPLINETITATQGGKTGTSGFIFVDTDVFTRLLVYQANENTIQNGVFVGSAPTGNNFPIVTDAPFATAPPNTPQVATAAHVATDNFFTVYACDAYGNNVTYTPNIAAYSVTITADDLYAVPVTPAVLSAGGGQAVIDLQFHTAQQGMWVHATTNYPGVSDFQTNTFTTYAGPAYGLQMLVPGEFVASGSGYIDTTFNQWHNGVAGTSFVEQSAISFTVQVQSCDVFGNFVSTPTDSISASAGFTTQFNTDSYPVNSAGFTGAFRGSLGDFAPGILTFTADFDISSGPAFPVMAFNDTSGSLLGTGGNPTLNGPTVQVILPTDQTFQITVNGVDYGSDGTNSTPATVLPDLFALTLNVIQTGTSNQVNGSGHSFLFTAVDPQTDVPTGINLNITQGQIQGIGWYATVHQGYSKAQNIRIRVTDPLGQIKPADSCIIDFGANSLSATMTLAAVPQNIKANAVSNVQATIIDGGNNPVPGALVQFDFLIAQSNGMGYFTILGETNTAQSITATSNANGIASAPFTGGYVNGRCVIQATYFGNPVQVTKTSVNVSLVDPSALISNYPNPFRAGHEVTYLSFLVPAANPPQPVNIKIYNLFGDLVYSTTLTSSQVQNLITTMGYMVTVEWYGENNKGKVVGNGGYIAVVDTGSGNKLIRKIAVRK